MISVKFTAETIASPNKCYDSKIELLHTSVGFLNEMSFYYTTVTFLSFHLALLS